MDMEKVVQNSILLNEEEFRHLLDFLGPLSASSQTKSCSLFRDYYDAVLQNRPKSCLSTSDLILRPFSASKLAELDKLSAKLDVLSKQSASLLKPADVKDVNETRDRLMKDLHVTTSKLKCMDSRSWHECIAGDRFKAIAKTARDAFKHEIFISGMTGEPVTRPEDYNTIDPGTFLTRSVRASAMEALSQRRKMVEADFWAAAAHLMTSDARVVSGSAKLSWTASDIDMYGDAEVQFEVQMGPTGSLSVARNDGGPMLDDIQLPGRGIKFDTVMGKHLMRLPGSSTMRIFFFDDAGEFSRAAKGLSVAKMYARKSENRFHSSSRTSSSSFNDDPSAVDRAPEIKAEMVRRNPELQNIVHILYPPSDCTVEFALDTEDSTKISDETFLDLLPIVTSSDYTTRHALTEKDSDGNRTPLEYHLYAVVVNPQLSS